MGIRDRDDNRKKYPVAGQSDLNNFERMLNRKHHGHQSSRQRNSANLGYLLLPALMLFGLWHGADRLLKDKAAQRLAAPETMQLVPGGLAIKADRQGHFRGTVFINDVPMPFLIDTGATKTTIPARLAYAAGLPIGAQVHSETAGGKVVDRLTQIAHLKIGYAEIRNLDANINQHLDEVLIGMNTLKYFNITQSGDTMTLVTNGYAPQAIAQPPSAPEENAPITHPLIQDTATSGQPLKKPLAIEKTVTCDSRQVCTTKYSDGHGQTNFVLRQ